MLMNYHEMTMNEPRDSPARRQQFLVICTVIFGVLVYTILQSGGLQPVTIEDGTFPGGEFVYKFTTRDYAAAQSLEENVGKKDLGLHQKREFVDKIYTIYLDDPNGLSGRRQRFASGYLISDPKSKDQQDKKTTLLTKNIELQNAAPTEKELDELGVLELWPKLEYQTVELPSVKAAVVQFPFTNGFVSALIMMHKIIPALRKHAAEHYKKDKKDQPAKIVIMSTCSIEDALCTHYAPLDKGGNFLLGQPDSETYISGLEPERFFDFEGAKASAKMIFPPLKWILKDTSSDTASDEL